LPVPGLFLGLLGGRFGPASAATHSLTGHATKRFSAWPAQI